MFEHNTLLTHSRAKSLTCEGGPGNQAVCNVLKAAFSHVMHRWTIRGSAEYFSIGLHRIELSRAGVKKK